MLDFTRLYNSRLSRSSPEANEKGRNEFQSIATRGSQPARETSSGVLAAVLLRWRGSSGSPKALNLQAREAESLCCFHHVIARKISNYSLSFLCLFTRSLSTRLCP